MNINTRIDGFKLGTELNEIHVPDRLRVRQNLGIDWVNAAFGGGGMTPSTVGMLTGMPGCGKSTLLRQLASSINGQGHIAVYNTGEESPYQVKMRCEAMELSHSFKVGQETYTGTLLSYLRRLQGEHPKKQVFLLQDSLQTLNDGHYRNGGTTSMTPVRCCEQLLDWAKETFGIVLFVGHSTKDGVFAGKNTIRHAVDLHAELLKDTDPRSPTYRQLLFTVSKNRFGFAGKSYVVGLEKKGLVSLADVNDLRMIDEDEEGEEAEACPPKVQRTQSGFRAKVAAPGGG